MSERKEPESRPRRNADRYTGAGGREATVSGERSKSRYVPGMMGRVYGSTGNAERRGTETRSGSRYASGEAGRAHGSTESGNKPARSKSRYASGAPGREHGNKESGNRTVRSKSRYASGSMNRESVAAGAAALRMESHDDRLKFVEDHMKMRRHRKLLLAGKCFLGLLAVAYIITAVYFGFHFYEGTVIYGIDCSQMTSEQAKTAVSQKLQDYKLTLLERKDVEETISAKQIDLEFVDNSSIDRMLRSQRPYIWPVMILLKKSAMTSVAFTYDRDKAEKVLNQMDCFNSIIAVRPQDAYIGNTETGFEIVPEVMGTTLDKEKALEAVLEALDQGALTLSFDEKDCYIAPTVYSDNEKMNEDVAALNELVRANITYDFGDRTEVVNADTMRDWIVELDDGTFVIDDIKVEEYVTELAMKYDTFGMEREFYTSYGTTVTLNGGDYGWAMDQGETVLQLMKAINEGYVGTMEPEYTYTAMSRDANDIGYTYVEICISQQRMICYKDGYVIVDTPVVTGNPNKGNATPSGGVWAIDAKMRDYVLVGEGYQAPVDYWMPFNGDVGIHDMKERAYFGGSIYLSNGSHGCVNTPYEQVAQIYDAVSIGTPVIVYDYP